MDSEMPKQVQDKLMQFQTIQSQLQLTSMQKQQMVLQSADIDMALAALKEGASGKIYRSAGPLMIEAEKESTEKRLSDDKELFETRVKMLEKQEKTLSERMNALRSELQSMVRPGGGVSSGG